MPWRTVASILADSTRYSLSLPQRDTTRGKSWLSQKMLFQPHPWRPTCQCARIDLNLWKSRGARSHLEPPSTWSVSVWLNWKTIENSEPSGLLYPFARSTVALQVSPTVTRSPWEKVSRLSSRKYSCRRGPFARIFSSGTLAMRSTASRRNPATPRSIHQRIMS